jgi:hypothetical protein
VVVVDKFRVTCLKKTKKEERRACLYEVTGQLPKRPNAAEASCGKHW